MSASDLPKPSPLTPTVVQKKIKDVELRQQDMVQYAFAKYFGGVGGMDDFVRNSGVVEKVQVQVGEEEVIVYESTIPPVHYFMTSNSIVGKRDLLDEEKAQ